MRSTRPALIVWLAFARIVAASAAADRPNIVVILADDMGYSDLGCHGGEIATPNLDALASGGLRFAQFYNNARCCPTRASLMTGLYPHQAGVGHMTDDRGHDGYRGVLNRNSATIAEVLRPSGYRPYMCGKWHLSRSIDAKGDRASWPTGRGFEKYYGTLAGAGSYYDPGALRRGEAVIPATNDPEYAPDSYYYTDAITDNAARFLRQHRDESPDKPFFLYVAYTAAHWPLQAPERAIAKYKGRYDAGYAAIRSARFDRMRRIGLIPADSTLSPIAEDWSDVADKAWEARCMETYAAMVETMDAGVGRIVAQLKESKQFDNTLILFMQDNGACAENTGRSSNGDGPGDLQPIPRDQAQPRTGPPMRTRDGRWVRTGPGVMPGPADTYVAYGRGWANVSNTPFREYKHWTHEGGISTPLIAHWPNGIRPDRAGQFERQPAHLIDVMATCVDLAGATYPAEVAGRAIKPREGVSLRPAFDGRSLNRPGPIFWEHESNRAVRDGDWKLVAKAGQPWELYNIAVDRAERDDLAGSRPSMVKDLAAKWDAYAARSNVLPLGAWRADDSDGVEFSKQKRFALKPGEHLGRLEAPAISGRPFAIEARFKSSLNHPDGAIVAQGGSAQGYALLMIGGRPRFLVRSGEGPFQVEGPRLADGDHAVTARIDAKGTLTLVVDGQAAAAPVPGKLLTRMPTDGLDVGADRGGAVGTYQPPFAYAGAIESVIIEVGDR